MSLDSLSYTAGVCLSHSYQLQFAVYCCARNLLPQQDVQYTVFYEGGLGVKESIANITLFMPCVSLHSLYEPTKCTE